MDMKYRSKTTRRVPLGQRGITLVEALVALLVLALGILGLAVVQGRTLVETRTANSRATAIRLISDLSERVRLNYMAESSVSTSGGGAGGGGGGGGRVLAAGGTPVVLAPVSAAPAPSSSQGTSPYVMSPSDAFQKPPATASVVCASSSTSSCSPQDQASYDVWYWRAAVANALPSGVAYITQVSNSRQLQVVIAWRLNENTNATLNGGVGNPQVAASYQQLSAPLQITDLQNGATNPCTSADNALVPQTPGYICHVDFIDIPNGN
jgi:type IV pilus assembly protein PilV